MTDAMEMAMSTESTTSWIVPVGGMSGATYSSTGNASVEDWAPSPFFTKSSTRPAFDESDDEDDAWVRLSMKGLALWADENPYGQES